MPSDQPQDPQDNLQPPEASQAVAPQEAAPVDPEAPQAAASEGQDPSAPAADEGGEEGEDKGGKGRPGGFQRRIQRLERHNQTLEQQNQMLLEQMQRLSGTAVPGVLPVAGKPGEKPPEQQAAEYIGNLVQQQLAQERQRMEFQQRVAKTVETHPDWHEVVSAVRAPVSRPVEEAILTSEHGPAIMYELATNPAELARLNALPPVVAMREVWRLEAKVASGATPQATAPNAVPRKPAAPAPISPVKARGPTNVKPVDQMSYEEYSAWRNSQRTRR